MYGDLVSIIISAYNCENYIEKCVESVLSQTYKNIEIVIVDDGSTDDTFNLVQRYTSNNFISFKKTNGGSSSARNYGLKYTTGSYVCFLDGDDYLENDFVQRLMEHSTGKRDEIIMCYLILEEQNCYSLREKYITGKDQIFNQFMRGGIYNSSVNKLYPSEMLCGIWFPEGRDLLEDAFFTSHVLERADSVIGIPYAGYHYIRHEGSLTRQRVSDRLRSGRMSNILEKDIVVSKYISQDNYEYLCTRISEHIREAINSIIDLELFDVYEKIRLLCAFLTKVDNSRKSMGNCLVKTNTSKKLRKEFIIFTILHGKWQHKIITIKSFIKIFIKKLVGKY